MLPGYILKAFDRIPHDAPEAAFYGPWNSVLFHFFNIKEGYTISPQYPVITGERNAIDFVVALTVQRDDFHVNADDQMHQHFYQLYDNDIPPKLYGISAFGSQCCTYQLDKDTGSVHPTELPRSQEKLGDLAPRELWD
ncbi:hypothetical protein CPC08DRAFT_771358 [Agrocybe pediades]|nr:hypothetical protein CPC08DRAFT_771358 [Agrocybe pediades]